MSSINEQKYPAKHPAVSNKSPEPLAAHVKDAEDKANRERAIRIVMATKVSGKYPEYKEAAEIADKKGVDKILAEADRAAQAASAPLPERPTVGAPHPEVKARLDNLEDRVTALEAKTQAKPKATANEANSEPSGNSGSSVQ